MALTVTTTPGKQFGTTEAVDIDGLNLLGQPTFAITGTTDTGDIAGGAITSVKMAIDRNFYLTEDSFSSSTYNISSDGSTQAEDPASYFDGMIVAFKALSDNDGATDLNVASLGAKNLYKFTDGITHVELEHGDIVSGQIVTARYDGAAFQMLSPRSLPDSFQGVGAINGSPNWDVTISYPVGSTNIDYTELNGRPFYVRFNAASVGSDTITPVIGGVTLSSAKGVRRSYDKVIAAGDWQANQEVLLMYNATTDTFQMLSIPATALDPVTIEGSYRNLNIENKFGQETTQIDITADELVLKKADGTPIVHTNVSVTANSALGAGVINGIETGGGALAQDTWYYIWVISDGTTPAALLTHGGITSADAPDDPSTTGMTGYETPYMARVGVVRTNSGAATFERFVQRDREVFIEAKRFPSGSAHFGTEASWTILDSSEITDLRASVPMPIVRGLNASVGESSSCGMYVAACQSDGTLYSGEPPGVQGFNQAGVAAGVVHWFQPVENFRGIPLRGSTASNKAFQYISRNSPFMYITGYTI